MPTKKPENYRTKATSSLELPRVVAAADYRYHMYDAAGIAQPLVFWSEPHGETAGSAAGDHDGLRDGYSSGAAPRGWTRIYCSLADYLAAGNPDPR